VRTSGNSDGNNQLGSFSAEVSRFISAPETVVFISLQQLEQRPVRFNIDVPAGEIEFDGKITQVTPLHVEGSAQLLSQSLDEIRVQGDLKVRVSADCDRCLEPFDLPIEHHFDLTYLPVGNSPGGEDEVSEAAIDVGFYEGNGLSLNDVLREVVLLALPMQLVHDESCKGMCPVCGQNRNQVSCDCQHQSIDDRWIGLKEFRAETGHKN